MRHQSADKSIETDRCLRVSEPFKNRHIYETHEGVEGLSLPDAAP